LKVTSMELPLPTAEIEQEVSDDPKKDFSELYQKYIYMLHGFLSRHLDSQEDVEDLAQEVYLRIARKHAQETIRYPKTYILKTAGNLLKEHARKNWLRKKGQHIPISEIELVCSAPSPEEILQSKQVLAIIEEVLKKVKPEARQAFILHRFKGLKCKKIASGMGISDRMVKYHIKEVLSQCRKKLQKG